MDVNDIGKTGGTPLDFSTCNEQQKQTAIERGRYMQDEAPKDYSKYFKIIIALLLIPYIVKLIQFIVLVDAYNDIADLFNKLL